MSNVTLLTLIFLAKLSEELDLTDLYLNFSQDFFMGFITSLVFHISIIQMSLLEV